MNFMIQVCNPLMQHPAETRVEDIRDAIELIFPLVTEKAILLWNRIPVLIDYKYDMSVIIDDMLQFLSELLDPKRDFIEVIWCSDTFNALWLVNRVEGRIKIQSEWRNVSGGYETLLNDRNELDIHYNLFMQEWKQLLKKIRDAIEQEKLYVRNQESLIELRRIENAIRNPGHLYDRM